MVVYYTGAVSEGRAALMLVNKTDVDIKKDLNFSISWSYDGKTIFDNQKVVISSRIWRITISFSNFDYCCH